MYPTHSQVTILNIKLGPRQLPDRFPYFKRICIEGFHFKIIVRTMTTQMAFTIHLINSPLKWFCVNAKGEAID